MADLKEIKRALISVSDKTGIIEFCTSLSGYGIEIISTGGTAKLLRDAGLRVTEVSEITEFPEMLDGRVKTLHPKIHGGILGIRENAEHAAQMKEYGIEPIDLVVIDLYPFEKTIAKEGVSFAEAIENIDIGGPAMIRSASKNWEDVAVIVSADLYPLILGELSKNDGKTSAKLRQMLSMLAFIRTSSYDAIISNYLQDQIDFDGADEDTQQAIIETALSFTGEEAAIDEAGENGDEAATFIEEFDIELDKIADLRYGENPHQQAGLYKAIDEAGGIANSIQLQGKEMSFNNYLDADAAWNLVNEFESPACAIIKHTNPCGAATGTSLLEAYKLALQTDTVSAFGGIVAFNGRVDKETAIEVMKIFTEVIVAPEYDEDALEIFAEKKNLRILQADLSFNHYDEEIFDMKRISGGMLIQEQDQKMVTAEELKIVSKIKPSADQLEAMLFAWKICKHTKSNAIVLCNKNQTVGVGSGQMNRVDSVRIAGMRAERSGIDLSNIVLASDAFFPFRDGVDECAKLGITAIIQPGGSVRDEEVIQAADEHGLAMAFTGIRHFRH